MISETKKRRLQIVVSILILAAIAALAVFENVLTNWQYSQIKPATTKDNYTDIRLAMLVKCQNCHIEKRPNPGCGNLTHREWAACTDKFYGASEAPDRSMD